MTKPTVTKQLSREALEFAPGLLSIQESPPPKLPRVMMYIMTGLFVILLIWAIFGKLDVVATAEGRLLPETFVKIVQPADSGIVKEILVHEGEQVKAGQILMKMDSNLTQADNRSIKNELMIKSLQLRRIDAELHNKKMQKRKEDPDDLYSQVIAQYRARRLSYEGAIAQEKATLSKVRFDLKASQGILEKLQKTVPIYQSTALKYENMAKAGFVGKVIAEDKQREKIEKEQDLQSQIANVSSLKEVITSSEKRLSQITSNYLTELHNERVEMDSQYRKLKEEWNKIVYKGGLLELKAPQAGTLKDLATHTIGTVVSPGTVLMTIVPHDEPLQAEIMLKNQDVGFVHEGLQVMLKLAAYPFQKYGMIEGTVTHVGADAIDDTSAQVMPADMYRYKVMIKLHVQHLELENTRLKLAPGMQVIAEIHQGHRTVMEYLLSPVRRAWLEAARER